MAEVLDLKFGHYSCYYIHFQTNTLEKGMKPFILSPVMVLNSSIAVLLQG